MYKQSTMHKNQEAVDELGRRAYDIAQEIYPFCRSLTGEGVRQTLKALQRHIPLAIHEVPSGTTAYDWTVPLEWNVRDAYIKDAQGRRVIDFQRCNLHLVGYSVPFKGTLKREELLKHVHVHPTVPDAVPYRHSYYQDSWGFCATHRQREELLDEQYEVCVDTSLVPGHLTYGEVIVPGRTDAVMLVWTHTCHPSLANDNASGIGVAAVLAACLGAKSRHLTYRIVFGPATLGPLVWLSANEAVVPRIQHGIVLACAGDLGSMTYVRSRRGNAPVDRAMAHCLKQAGRPYVIRDFAPEGYDQRQFCSPGFDLAMGCVMRTPYGEYAQYHTSADDMTFITPAGLGDTMVTLLDVCDTLDNDRTYVNTNPYGEPHLGKRGLYQDAASLGMGWTLNYSDGRHSLLDIAERANMPFAAIAVGAERLRMSGLLREITRNN